MNGIYLGLNCGGQVITDLRASMPFCGLSLILDLINCLREVESWLKIATTGISQLLWFAVLWCVYVLLFTDMCCYLLICAVLLPYVVTAIMV